MIQTKELKIKIIEELNFISTIEIDSIYKLIKSKIDNDFTKRLKIEYQE